MSTLTDHCLRPVIFAPLTGILDARSLPGELDPANWRWLQNFTVTGQGKLCRSPGWEKLLSVVDYNNQDLHDQLLGLAFYYDHTDTSIDRFLITDHPHAACSVAPTVVASDREPVTFLMESQSTTGLRKLLAGTRSRLYALNESKGNWKLLDYGKGGKVEPPCAKVRWYGAQVADTVILTNNIDPVQSWDFDQPAFGCDQRSTSPVADLAILNVTKASVVTAWKGVIFLADVEMDGLRINHRVLWGDKDNPVSYDPSKPESVSGYFDLDYGEKVLGMAPMGNNLLIYTTRGIWRVLATGGEEVFTFDKIYAEPKSGQACIAYRNTLVSDGGNHYYLGTDALYVFNLFIPKPEAVEWMHRATSLIFEGADPLNSAACDNHIAGYNSEIQELWVCWQKKSQTCPGQTLRFNLKYRQSFYLDHGFTAFTNFNPDPRQSINDFLMSRCICDPEVLGEMPAVVKESVTTCLNPAADAGCETPTSIYTSERITIEDGLTQENWDKLEADAGSLCEAMGDLTFDDLCDSCNVRKLFVMASSSDYSLKQYGEVYFRERYVHALPADRCDPSYTQDSFATIGIKGPLNFGSNSEEKEIGSLSVQYDADESTDPLELKLTMGSSAQPIDPSPFAAKASCGIMWSEETENRRHLECLDSKSGPGVTSAEQHAIDHTVPSLDLVWPLYTIGHFIFLKLTVDDPGGGSFCWSGIIIHAKKNSGCLQG